MKVLHTIRDTPPNPHGLCALSITHDNCLLAYPGSAHNGEVQIFDADQLVSKSRGWSWEATSTSLPFIAEEDTIMTSSKRPRKFGLKAEKELIFVRDFCVFPSHRGFKDAATQVEEFLCPYMATFCMIEATDASLQNFCFSYPTVNPFFFVECFFVKKY
jgi:hypothetical protein